MLCCLMRSYMEIVNMSVGELCVRIPKVDNIWLRLRSRRENLRYGVKVTA